MAGKPIRGARQVGRPRRLGSRLCGGTAPVKHEPGGPIDRGGPIDGAEKVHGEIGKMRGAVRRLRHDGRGQVVAGARIALGDAEWHLLLRGCEVGNFADASDQEGQVTRGAAAELGHNLEDGVEVAAGLGLAAGGVERDACDDIDQGAGDVE